MRETSVPVRLLYYLNTSEKDQALKHIAADQKVFDYYIRILGMSVSAGYSDAASQTKKIIKLLRQAV